MVAYSMKIAMKRILLDLWMFQMIHYLNDEMKKKIKDKLKNKSKIKNKLFIFKNF